MAKPWILYLEQLNADAELLEIYRKIRQQLKDEGFSNKDIEKMPYIPLGLMRLANEFSGEKIHLVRTLNLYFGDVPENEVMEYIKPKLEEIDKEIPLSDVDYSGPIP